MLELKAPVSAYSSSSYHRGEVDMTWINDYNCVGHAWLTYDQTDRKEYSNDMTKILAVAYKWSKLFTGMNMGLPSFLDNERIDIEHPDGSEEAFYTSAIQSEWDSYEPFDVKDWFALTSIY
jgi:hypothetical protein